MKNINPKLFIENGRTNFAIKKTLISEFRPFNISETKIYFPVIISLKKTRTDKDWTVINAYKLRYSLQTHTKRKKGQRTTTTISVRTEGGKSITNGKIKLVNGVTVTRPFNR